MVEMDRPRPTNEILSKGESGSNIIESKSNADLLRCVPADTNTIKSRQQCNSAAFNILMIPLHPICSSAAFITVRVGCNIQMDGD